MSAAYLVCRRQVFDLYRETAEHGETEAAEDIRWAIEWENLSAEEQMRLGIWCSAAREFERKPEE